MANRLNYIAGDFSSIRHELIQKLKSMPAFKDQTESSIGQTLIRLYAYLGDLLVYRINTLANENYLGTVQIKDNLLKLIKILNYKPKRAIPSYGEVALYIREANDKNIVIPQGTKLSTSDGILFYTMYESELLAGEKTINVDIVQGLQKEEFVKSSGSANQEFILNSNNKNYYLGETILPGTVNEFSSLKIFVDDEEWIEVDSLVNATSIDKYYYVETISDYSIKIIFGDGSFGVIPTVNSIIKFQYNVNLGSYGNVNLNTITSVVDTISDINNNPIKVYVTHTSSFLNGGNPEDIEEIRNNAPTYFKTGDRGVTDTDFMALIENNFSNILDSYVYGEEDKTPPNFKLFNQVNIVILLADSDGLPLIPSTNDENYLSFYRDVDQLIKDKRSLTVWRKYIVPEPVKIQFKVRYKKLEGYTDSEIRAAIEEAIENYLKDNGRLSTTIKSSDMIHNIEEINGIDYCYLEMKRETDIVYSTANITTLELEFPTKADGTYITLIRE